MMLAIGQKVVAYNPYSIDESFCLLTGMRGDWEEIGRDIQRHVLKMVGIPCGVGISRTRTTAKLANWASKNWKRQTSSVVALTEYQRLRKLLVLADVSEVWGIGSRLTAHLNSYGITTAVQLADADPKLMRKRHGVTLERTVRELNWEYCLGYEDHAEPKQTMSCTRTFPQPITDRQQLCSSIATYASNLGRKLRKDRLLCVALQVFLQPARGCVMTPPGKSSTIGLPLPSNDTRILTEYALNGMAKCYREGGRWIRAGVIVVQTVEEAHFVPDLFAPQPRPRSDELMQTIDRINRLSGEGTVRFAGEHRHIGQTLRRNYPSNRFTTSWKELPEAY